MSQNVSVTNRFWSHYLRCFFLFPMQEILPQERGESLGKTLKKEEEEEEQQQEEDAVRQ